MKMNAFLTIAILACAMFAIQPALQAQDYSIQYFRPWDQNGINQFEPSKADSNMFKGFKVRIGGSFTQQFQALSHENINGENGGGALYNLGTGFNLATANLNLDIQLDDGIRVSLENYMSSRHHAEFWVKGGYIQFDKLPMFGSPQWFTDNFRVRIGHFEVNYGDQHFRRTDNGNAMFNPFVGNYILDAFATEIGGEAYYMKNNITAMLGMTSGIINGNVLDYSDNPNDVRKNPAVYGKLIYDRQVDSDLRFRLSGSVYHLSNGPRNTLYSGDRTGSRYYLVMEEAGASAGSAFTSGRFNPGFTNQVTAIQFNPFLKYGGLEFFGTLEISSGKSSPAAEDRSVMQLAGDLIYRFGAAEDVFIGARYNTLSGELFNGSDAEANIDRFALSAGWFPNKNLLLKGEYVNQSYVDFPTGSLLEEGKFSGLMVEAVIGF